MRQMRYRCKIRRKWAVSTDKTEDASPLPMRRHVNHIGDFPDYACYVAVLFAG